MPSISGPSSGFPEGVVPLPSETTTVNGMPLPLAIGAPPATAVRGEAEGGGIDGPAIIAPARTTRSTSPVVDESTIGGSYFPFGWGRMRGTPGRIG